MPLTFPAHQAVVIPAKIRWPNRLDATAMCVGAAAPDLTYPLLSNQGQTLLGGLLAGVPLTLLVCVVLRWRAANGVFANLPDMGPWRVHSYRVITRRWPPLPITVMSAVVGVISHVAIDSVTHDDRLLARLLGFDHVLFHLPRIHDVSIALLLQLMSHVVGSVAGVWLFWLIGSRRLLDEWYGAEVVADARRIDISPLERVVFWAVVALSTGAVYLAFVSVDTRWIFKLILGATIGLLVAGSTSAVGSSTQ